MNISFIDKELKNELEKLIEYCEQHIHEFDYDLEYSSEFLKQHLKDEIESISTLMVDTLINIKMKETLKRIENLDDAYKSSFYDRDIRNAIRQEAHSTSIEGYQIDFENIHSLYLWGPPISASISLAAFSLLGFLLFKSIESLFVAILLGVAVTIFTTLMTYFFSRDYIEKIVRKRLSSEIRAYVESSRKEIMTLIDNLDSSFDESFNNFLSSENIDL